MPCQNLYRSGALDILSCTGDATRRLPAATRWPSYEVHFQDDGAYFLHDGADPTLVDVHCVEVRRAGLTQVYSRPVVPVDRGTSIRFDPSALGAESRSVATTPAADIPCGIVLVGRQAFAELQGLRRALDARAVDGTEVERRALALAERVVRAAARRRDRAAQPGRRATSVRHQRAVGRARTYLVEHCHERPTLADTACAADYAPHHLARVFRDETGLAVHEYLSELRLRQAAIRLDGRPTNLASLALDLGYSTQSHFTTVFRERFGCTPGAYRARAR